MAKSKVPTDPIAFIQDRLNKLYTMMQSLDQKLDGLTRASKRQADALTAAGLLPQEAVYTETRIDIIRVKLLAGATCEFQSDDEYELIAPLVGGGWALHRACQWSDDERESWVTVFAPEQIEEMLDLITFPEDLQFFTDRDPLDAPLKGYDSGYE